MPILFLIVFVNLVGFGIIIPLLPFYVLRLGVSPEVITITIAVYSLVQFITSPFWGKLSDKYGRKPILVVTLGGTVISYIMLGFADSLLFLVLTRAFGGLMAGNLGAAYAYVADISTPQTRAKAMGMLGAAFGLGFILGPAIGGFLAGNEAETANYLAPAMAAAALSAVAALVTFFFLPESLKPEIKEKIAKQPKVPLATQLATTFQRPTLSMLVIMSFMFVAAWALLETIFALWANKEFSYGPRTIALILTWVGVVSVIVQGGLIGPLTKRFGEEALTLASLMIATLGFLCLAASASLWQILASMSILAVASGLFNPSSSSLVSKEAADTERGVVLGVYQGMSSLGRVMGPAVSGLIFAQLGTAAPYLISAAIMVPAMTLMWMVVQRHRAAQVT